MNGACSHMRWFSAAQRRAPLPVFQRVAAMPRRASDYPPRLTIYAENMTVETGAYCPGSIKVGEFAVLNAGFPAVSPRPPRLPCRPMGRR